MSYDPKRFWEDRAGSLVNENFQTEKDWEAIKEHIRSDLPTIEIGCGQGRWSEYFDWYTGIDISERLIKAAEEKYGGARPFVRFKVQDIRDGFPRFYPQNGQVFTYTALEHISPEDIVKIQFPAGLRLVFVEPPGEFGVEHCFQHDYEALFGVKKVKDLGVLAVFVREP